MKPMSKWFIGSGLPSQLAQIEDPSEIFQPELCEHDQHLIQPQDVCTRYLHLSLDKNDI